MCLAASSASLGLSSALMGLGRLGMLDRKEIAKMMGISPRTMRDRVEPRPDFPKPALKLSRKTVRWDESDVLKWIHRQRLAKS
jgi:predicted DNA-binding transcriptional regulator AlpA